MVYRVFVIVAIAIGLSSGAKIQGNNVADNLESDDRALGYSCKDNEFDKDQYCKCRPGERISYFHSEHDNGHEDRVWSLKCEAIQSDRPFPEDTDVIESHENGWDQHHRWNTKFTLGGGFQFDNKNSFLVGMKSEHSDDHEDRKYTFFHTQSEDWLLTNCQTDWVNKFDEEIDIDLSSTNQVIAGIESYHNSRKEDRRFKLTLCDLVPKCANLDKIVYDYEGAENLMQNSYFGTVYQNNLINPTEEEPLQITIYTNEEHYTGESYSYEHTSGYELGTSLELSFNYNWGVGDFTVATLAGTVGMSSTWNTEETWSRSQENGYTEGSGKEITMSDTCPASKFCLMYALVKQGETKIPYTIYAYTEEEREVMCIEHGTLTLKNAQLIEIKREEYDHIPDWVPNQS